ncbi:MAG TPA: ABC transporter permease [Vicinamibacterales bacterium]|nr:ABC transporter permease [Vicinamibacterales bacterium]
MKRSLRSWLWRVPLDQEVDEEITFHIEMRTRELVERGLDPKTAREVVLARIGDAGRLKRTIVDLGRKRDREMRLTQFIEELRDDVKFAVRQLRRAPGFTLVAAITLALGIGANSAMFALADATLLRPLPFRDSERLVLVLERGAQQLRSNIAPLNMRDWAAQNRTFEAMEAAFVSPGDGGPTLITNNGIPETVIGQQVTPGFFDLLGVRPIAGRTFLADDETSNANVVVLSEGFWRTRFGGDLTIVGRDINLDGRPATVVGIVPAAFHFQRTAGLWRLLPIGDALSGRRLRFNLQVIGRLKPGVTIEAARADLTPLADALATQYGDRRVGRYITVTPLRDALIGGELRLTSMLFLGVVGFVLLMCCANVANLLLARATARARELALRSALGAGRRRIVVQLLTESLVLAAIGGALGVGIGAAILAVAPSMIPPDLLPGAITLAFDGRVMAFCAATTLLVGVLFGLVPAWQATGISLVQTLTSDTRTSTGRGGAFRQLLVAAEVAAAVLLLCGAGLLLRTLLTLEGLPRGYGADADSVLTMDVTLDEAKYRTPDSFSRFHNAVEDEVLALPGVRSAAWATTLPLGNAQIGRNAFQIVGDPPAPPDDRPMADYQIVSPTYFETLRLPIVAGRGFSDRDTAQSVQVCIVNEAFVRRHLGGRNPIGIRLTLSANVVREVVGVARQVKGDVDERQDLAQVYVPNAQLPYREGFLVVSPIDGRADALAPAVRAAFARVDKEQPIRRMVTLADVAREATARYRFRAVMVVTFAGLALVLAMVGVFGVLAYSVQQRSREFGVRIALGATTTNVLGLVLGGAARVIGIGAVIGLMAAAALGQSISTFLFGVQPIDPVTFASVAAVLALTAAVATAAPAWRAARVDPVVAFRND